MTSTGASDLEYRVRCPFCGKAAPVKKNKRDDPFFSCPACGAFNLRGPRFREWIDKNKVRPSFVGGERPQSQENQEGCRNITQNYDSKYGQETSSLYIEPVHCAEHNNTNTNPWEF